MILGFGDTETKTAISIIEECISKRNRNKEIFEQEIKKIKDKYYDLQEQYNDKSTDDVPERYSYFWFSVYKIYDGYFIITFWFHHINRRHPFSADGWALLKTYWIAEIKFNSNDLLDEEIRIYKSV